MNQPPGYRWRMTPNELFFRILKQAFPDDKIPRRFRIGARLSTCFLEIQTQVKKLNHTIDIPFVLDLEYRLQVTEDGLTLINITEDRLFRVSFNIGMAELDDAPCPTHYLDKVSNVIDGLLKSDGAIAQDCTTWTADSAVLRLIAPVFAQFRLRSIELLQETHSDPKLNLQERTGASLMMVMALFQVDKDRLSPDIPVAYLLDFARAALDPFTEEDSDLGMSTESDVEPRPKKQANTPVVPQVSSDIDAPIMHRRSGEDLENPLNVLLDILGIPTTPAKGSPDWMDAYGRPKLIDPEATKVHSVPTFKPRPIKQVSVVEWPEL
jgi:hypothetical protein